jgi:hypothetical protein
VPDARGGAGDDDDVIPEIEGETRTQCTLPPPSTSSVCPDMKSLSSEAR